jgi:hypothetical protein
MIIRDGELKHTPDVLRLQQRSNWLVFLCCELQHRIGSIENQAHQQWLEEGFQVWEGFTKEHFTMWKNDLGKLSHPVVFKREGRLSAVSHNKVRGNIVRMRTPRLIKLDGERQNGVQFQRVRVQVSVPHFALIPVKDRSSHQRLHGGNYVKGDYQAVPCEQLVWAWMYIGRPEFWLEDLRKVNTVKFTRSDARRNDEHILVLNGKTVASVPRYLPNNENNEPYYYFAPNECT